MAFCNRLRGLARQSKSGLPNVASMSSTAGATSPCRLYVQGLRWSVSEKDLKDSFSKFGRVDNAEIKVDQYSGAALGYGFVYFSSHESAQKAIGAMDGEVIHGQVISVRLVDQHDDSPAGGDE